MDVTNAAADIDAKCAYHQLSKTHPLLVRWAQFRSYASAYGLGAALVRGMHVLGATRTPPAAPPTLNVVPTDGEVLALRPAEWVEVRSVAEIRATLDARGCFRGLYFMDEMWSYCDRRFQVLKRMDRLMVESTGRMRTIKNTVLLDGTSCDGSAHKGCDASCQHLWREIWLRRVTNEERLDTLPVQAVDEQHYA